MSRHNSSKPLDGGTGYGTPVVAASATAAVGVVGLALAALAWAGPVMKAVSSQAPAGRS